MLGENSKLSKYGRQAQRNEVADNTTTRTADKGKQMELYERSVNNSSTLLKLLQSGNEQSDLAKESVENARVLYELDSTEENKVLYREALHEQRDIIESKKRASVLIDASRSVSSVTSSSSGNEVRPESTIEKKRTITDLRNQFDSAEKY